jgi:hypothetical protein
LRRRSGIGQRGRQRRVHARAPRPEIEIRHPSRRRVRRCPAAPDR